MGIEIVKEWHYDGLDCREFVCPGCGIQKWMYAWPDDIDNAIEECHRAHVLCSAREVDVVTGQIVA